MAKHLTKGLDIGGKSRFTPLTHGAFHSGPPAGQELGLCTISCSPNLQQYSIEDFVTQ
jgi:hypothetical protein